MKGGINEHTALKLDNPFSVKQEAKKTVRKWQVINRMPANFDYFSDLYILFPSLCFHA